MSYGLYIYKDLPRNTRLEIFRKEWTGPAKEIKAMGSIPLQLVGLDNSGADVLTPIIKSSLNINIKDLGEIDYRELFTSYATKFKVIVKRNDIQEWGGYLTPDSYSQDLSYRSSVNLIARDNLGMLDQLDFDWFDHDFVKISELIVRAQEKIEWVMKPIYWFGQQNTPSNGEPMWASYINTIMFKEKTWWEALEMILSSLGQQMRYVGGNEVYICNVADLYELGNVGGIHSLDYALGDAANMEITPSWKEVTIKQDYGVIKELLSYTQKDGYFEFVKMANNGQKFNLYYNNYFTQFGNGLLYYNNYDYINSNAGNTEFSNIFLVNFRESRGYVYKSFRVGNYKNGFEFKISAWNFPASMRKKQADGTKYIHRFRYLGGNEWIPAEITLRLSVQYMTDSGRLLYMDAQNWTVEEKIIEFKLGQYKPEQTGLTVTWNDELKTFTVVILNIPDQPGELRLCVHQPSVSGNELGDSFGTQILDGYADTVLLKDFRLYATPNDVGGQDLTGSVNPDGNIKESINISFGEVPANTGDYLAYAGGLFDGTPYNKALSGWHRTDGKGGAMHLSELVGRGYAHHFTAFRNINDERTGGKVLTGTFPFQSTLWFSTRFQIDSEEYIINSATYDMIGNQASVSLFQVVPYVHEESSSFIQNAVSGGGNTIIGGGSKEIITWTNEGTGGDGEGMGYIPKRTYALPKLYDYANAVLLTDVSGSETATQFPLGKILSAKIPLQNSINEDGTQVITHNKVPKSNKLNRYGNVDQWGHLIEDFHPHGGRDDVDFAANAITVTQEITSPSFLSGWSGMGFQIRQREDGKWIGELDGLRVRDFLEATEFIISKVRAVGGELVVTNCNKSIGMTNLDNRMFVDGILNAEDNAVFPLEGVFGEN